MNNSNKVSKHTPGPWNVRFTGDKSIALDVWESLEPCERDSHYEQINTYDARLIAAAPELLAALQKAGEAFDTLSESLQDKHLDLIMLIAETLDKARGE